MHRMFFYALNIKIVNLRLLLHHLSPHSRVLNSSKLVGHFTVLRLDSHLCRYKYTPWWLHACDVTNPPPYPTTHYPLLSTISTIHYYPLPTIPLPTPIGKKCFMRTFRLGGVRDGSHLLWSTLAYRWPQNLATRIKRVQNLASSRDWGRSLLNLVSFVEFQTMS